MLRVMLEKGQEMARRPGRPPAEEPTEVIPVRIRVSERERLDQYLDHLESRVGLRASRSGVMARALTFYLDAEAFVPSERPRSTSPGTAADNRRDARDRVRADTAEAHAGSTTQTSFGIQEIDSGIPNSPPSPLEEALGFDPAKFMLGDGLCLRGHDYMGTGKSLRRRSNYSCRDCDVEQKRQKRAARQQAG